MVVVTLMKEMRQRCWPPLGSPKRKGDGERSEGVILFKANSSLVHLSGKCLTHFTGQTQMVMALHENGNGDDDDSISHSCSGKVARFSTLMAFVLSN